MSTNLPTDPQTAMDEFKAKVIADLRTKIGEYLPEAALAGLVQEAVRQEFFTKTTRQHDRYSAAEVQPSWFAYEVKKLAEPIIKEYAERWVVEHRGEVEEAVKAFLKEQNLLLTAMAMVHSQTHVTFTQWASELASQIAQKMKYG